MFHAKQGYMAALFVSTLTLPLFGHADPGRGNWSGEAGAGVAHYDNFFMTGDASAQQQVSALVSTIHASGRRDFRGAPRRWNLSGGIEASFNHDISDADTQQFWSAAEVRFDRARVGVDLGYQPNRIFSEEGEGIFLDELRFSLSGRYEFSTFASAALEYRRQRQTFDNPQRGRDADVDRLTGTVRLVLSEQAAVRLFAQWSEKDARDESNSWSATGVGLAMEWSPAPQWQLFSRVRWRDREYKDAPAGTSNFERDDTTLDALVNARVMMGSDWGLAGQLEYRDAESTRIVRNYDALTVSLGAFKQF